MPAAPARVEWAQPHPSRSLERLVPMKAESLGWLLGNQAPAQWTEPSQEELTATTNEGDAAFQATREWRRTL